MTDLSNTARCGTAPKMRGPGPSRHGASGSLARALGWFSIALGVTEIVAAERLARALGMRGKESLIRAYGLREIGSGILSLSVDKQVGLWSRVAGDGLNIATLLPGLREDNPKRGNVGIALAIVAGVTVLDIVGAQATSASHSRRRGQVRDFDDRGSL